MPFSVLLIHKLA